MGTAAMKLSSKRVAKFLHRPGRYGDGDGLYLQVSRPGRGSWILRYERAGRERAMGLGKLADFTLAEARQRARAARQLLADGVDPLDQRQGRREQEQIAAAKNVTFLKCAEGYIAAHSAEWSAKHHQQFVNSLRDHVHPFIGALPVADIDEALVLKVLAPIWKDKTVTAKRIRNRIESVIDYAVACKYRPTGTNPARWEGQLEYLLAAPEKIATVKHHAALPHADIAALIAELRGIDGVRARALEFLILTATRTGEVADAVWSEIDLGERMWSIPAERIKGKREHRVPLSDRGIEILRQLPREPNNPFVFVGTKVGTGID
jgi:integrase